MRRYLVVANQTLGGEQLTAKLAECIDRPESLLCGRARHQHRRLRPLVHRRAGGRAARRAYRIARTLAGARLEHELNRLREAGAEADGEVVEPMPLDAIRKIASREEADEVIVSTLPRRLSRWIAMDLPRRIRRATSLPVTHVAGQAGPLV
jgi:hypothetical protein